MSYNKKKKNQVKQKESWNWKLLPLQFVLCVLPLVLYLYFGNSGYSAYAWNSPEDYYSDVFLHGKMVAFMIVAVILVVLVIYRLLQLDAKSRKKDLINFSCLLVYLLFVILSTVCSEDISLSMKGAMDAKEPFLVLVGYVAVTFYAYLVIDNKEDLMQLTWAAVIGSVCMAVVGVLQTVGLDPVIAEPIQRLYAGSDYIDNVGLLTLNFPKGQAYGTLFNPNYVGTYVAMYVALLLVGVIGFKEVWKKALCGFSFVGLLIMLFASQSRTGLIAVAGVAVVLFFFLGRALWKYWYLVIPGITFVLMSFSLLDTYRDNLLTNRLKQMFAIEASMDPVLGVDTTGNGVRVVRQDTEYTVVTLVTEVDILYFAYEGDEQKEVTYTEDKSYGYFTLDNGEEIAIQTASYDGYWAFGLKINGRDFYFTNQVVAGNYKYINEVGRLDECIIAANVFPGYERVASSRGYSWGRSIPLLLKNFIVGSGPDTYAIEFPQNDYVGRYKCGFENMIFTRPHNFFLQMGVQTGTMSLLAFLTFYAIYFIGCCRRYWFRKFEKMEEWLGFAAFLGTIGFMASGLANDSLIVVTPIFYVLLGMGMAINHKLCPVVKKEKKSKEELEVKNEEEGLE